MPNDSAPVAGANQILCLEDPRALKGVFRGVEIGMRFHSLIMAAAVSLRFSYDPKVSQLMEELAMPGWDLAHCQMTPI